MDALTARDSAKFKDPNWTADGKQRATVSLQALETLWLNTGTLCNLTCSHCYIESSPTNDRLSYLTSREATPYFKEIAALNLPVEEIGFTGGEPFMNPDIMAMLSAALERGFSALVLTNAMKPMTHRREALLSLRAQYGDQLKLRVSVDHYTQVEHERERGGGSWAPTLDGLKWLSDNGFSVSKIE